MLTAMDCFTKYAVCVPLRNEMTTTVGKAAVEKIFLQYGLTEMHSADHAGGGGSSKYRNSSYAGGSFDQFDQS